jgi:hypothetical protein
MKYGLVERRSIESIVQDPAMSSWARPSTATMKVIFLGDLWIFLPTATPSQLARPNTSIMTQDTREFFLWREANNGGDAGHWTQIGQNITGEAIGNYFGWSVSLSDDGKTIAVGAPGNNGNGDDSGYVRVYRMSDSETEWTQLGVDIDGEQAGEWSGYSVSLSGDGNTVAIGSPYYVSDSGYEGGQVKVYIVE